MLRKQPKQPATPLGVEELIDYHRRKAENHMRRARGLGRLEARGLYASLATAEAVLAVSYQLADLGGRAVVPVDPDAEPDDTE